VEAPCSRFVSTEQGALTGHCFSLRLGASAPTIRRLKQRPAPLPPLHRSDLHDDRSLAQRVTVCG
jgi:hypothetical protein